MFASRASARSLVSLAVAVGLTLSLAATSAAEAASGRPGSADPITQAITVPSGPGVFVPDPALYRANELAKARGGLGAYRDQTTDRVVVSLPKASAASFTAADAASVGEVTTVHSSRFDAATVATMMSEIVGLRSSLAPGSSFYAGYDIRQDMFTIRGDAPEPLFSSFMAKYAGMVTYTHSDASLDSRATDSPPHWGGAQLDGQWALGSGYTTCTAGYTIQIGSTRYMVTAGHCFASGTTVYGGNWYYNWGNVNGRQDWPNTDVELISGSLMNGNIYVSDTGGMSVKGYAISLVGSYPYCLSGMTAGFHCQYTEYADGQTRCASYGCTSGLIAMTGSPTSSGGDSGGPWYVVGGSGSSYGAYIFGSDVGHAGAVSYLEPFYTRVQSLYGASIITG